jgi:uncharacterized protein
MSAQTRIDALQLAREGRRLEGEIAVSAMQRLHDIVSETSGSVRYCIKGLTDAKREPVLDVTVEARLALMCQRCLEPVAYDLRRTSRFVLTESERDLPDIADEDPETETLPADALADVEDLVEQEVLLGLPLAPMHPEGGCEGDVSKRASGERQSPFMVLEQLKRGS